MQDLLVVKSLQNVWKKFTASINSPFKPKLEVQKFYGFLIPIGHEFYDDITSLILTQHGYAPYGFYCKTYHENGDMTGYFIFGVPLREEEFSSKHVEKLNGFSKDFPPYLKFSYEELLEEQNPRVIEALVKVPEREDKVDWM